MELLPHHPALEVLLAFFSEMNAWELQAAEQHRAKVDRTQFERNRALRRAKLEEIFERFCEVGKEAERLQDVGVSFSLGKPEHEGESIVRTTERAGTVTIETEQPEERGWQYKYQLVDVAGEWRIRDNRKYRSKGETKWSKDLL
ncbi:MAG: hypothetical protein GXX96_11700 [Planctomycetaceae bacterium]|nr:hypothetical protein [Planctomycetaceae bacterium]